MTSFYGSFERSMASLNDLKTKINFFRIFVFRARNLAVAMALNFHEAPYLDEKSHFLDHHIKLFFHHHMKMFVNFFENFFLNYKLPKDDSEKMSDGYFKSKSTHKK